MSSDAEIDSFNCQSSMVNRTPPPPELQRAISVMESVFAPCKWEICSDFAEDTHILRVIDYIKSNLGDKSPGAVFLRMGFSTNKVVFEQLGVEAILCIVRERIDMLLTLEDTRYVSDPVRLFIKREATKKSKAEERRWRLIWGISLIDQIIDRILYTEVCTKEIEHCEIIPSKPGYSFKKGGVDRMVRKYTNDSKIWRSFDAKSFDWTAPAWGLRAVREVNERLCITVDKKLREKWIKLSKAREEAILFGSFCFSNGVVCLKLFACIQLSGRFTTISTNCKLVVLYRVIYEIRNDRLFNPFCMIAMGDDTVQDEIEDVGDFVLFIKDDCGTTFTIESEPGEFALQNFCSMWFEKLPNGTYVAIPLNWVKNSYELCHPEAKVCKDVDTLIENRGSALQSLCIEYAFHEKFEILHKLLAEWSPNKFRSHQWFKDISTGWENSGTSLSPGEYASLISFEDIHYSGD